MPSSSAAGTKLSTLGEDVAAPIQQPQQEIERFISLQTERVRADLEKKQKGQSKRLMAVLERAIAKKLKQKEAEIKSIGRVNCALEERVMSICIENQIWQNLARSRSSPRPTRAARRTPVRTTNVKISTMLQDVQGGHISSAEDTLKIFWSPSRKTPASGTAPLPFTDRKISYLHEQDETLMEEQSLQCSL